MAPAPAIPVATAVAEQASVVTEPPVPAPVIANAEAAEPPQAVPVAKASEPAKPAVVSPAVSNGRVSLAIAPWGEVYIDNKKVGISPPLTDIKVSPGKHNIEVRNGSFEPYRQSISLAANSSLRIKHKFE